MDITDRGGMIKHSKAQFAVSITIVRDLSFQKQTKVALIRILLTDQHVYVVRNKKNTASGTSFNHVMCDRVMAEETFHCDYFSSPFASIR